MKMFLQILKSFLFYSWIPNRVTNNEAGKYVFFEIASGFQKNIIISFMFFFFFFAFQNNASDMHITVQAHQTQKTMLGLVFVGDVNEDNKVLVERLKKDLEHSGQCLVSLKYVEKIKKTIDLKSELPTDVFVTIFISFAHHEYTWRLYDLISLEMIVGKKVKTLDRSPIVLAHVIADQVWPQLMGHSGSFGSKIAYCKQIWKKRYGKEKPLKEIWIADFDGSNAKVFVDDPTVCIAPRWGGQSDCPLLFYSENTLSNVQLVMSNMFKKRQVVCCFDGLNMQPTFSHNGKEVVFCLSKDGSSQLYHSYVHGLSKQRMCDRLTFNDGNNIAPCFIDEDRVAFVSDFETHKPQIYIMNVTNQKIERVTDGGYCACPSYCPVSNKLVYSKMIDKGMQLFEYDCATKKHTQLTKGPGSKEEPTWSACGNYIVFGMNEGFGSRIAQLNLITGKLHYLTSEKDHCTYPSCSPVYEQSIGILKE